MVETLAKGSYFGEIAIFFETPRTSYVQAESFCVLKELRKSDLDEITKSYPQVVEMLKVRANERRTEINEYQKVFGQSMSAKSKSGMNDFGNVMPGQDNFADDNSLFSDSPEARKEK